MSIETLEQRNARETWYTNHVATCSEPPCALCADAIEFTGPRRALMSLIESHGNSCANKGCSRCARGARILAEGRKIELTLILPAAMPKRIRQRI